jgi:hypothetical protein
MTTIGHTAHERFRPQAAARSRDARARAQVLTISGGQFSGMIS